MDFRFVVISLRYRIESLWADITAKFLAMRQRMASQPILAQERLAAGFANIVAVMLIHVMVQFGEILKLLLTNSAIIDLIV